MMEQAPTTSFCAFADQASAEPAPSQKRKWKRWNPSQECKNILLQHIAKHGYFPDAETRADLARRFDTTERRIQVFFQNQRQRKKQDAPAVASTGRNILDYALVARLLQVWSGCGDLATCLERAHAMLDSVGPEIGEQLVEHAMIGNAYLRAVDRGTELMQEADAVFEECARLLI